MVSEKIRPIAICLCRNGGRILVAEGYDSIKNQVFYRPLGGTIEFYERGEETVRREFLEEIGATVTDVRYLGTLESIFVCEGRRGHEIVLVYDGKLTDQSLYQKDMIVGNELGVKFEAFWKGQDEFGDCKPPVYPDGLLDLLVKV